MARPHKSDIAPGVFPRGRKFWLRYTPEGGGKQVRRPLDTSDPVEAIRKAVELRGKPLPGKTPNPRWDRAVSAYVETGLKTKTFRKNTVDTILYASRAFRKWTKVTAPEEATSKLLQAFYDVHSGYRKPAKAESPPTFVNIGTAQGYVSKLGTFLRRSGIVIKLDFRGQKPDSKDVVVPSQTIHKLIAECKRSDLKFVLFAGFHTGLRKEEIIMARPQWFKLDLGHLSVPKLQTVEGRYWEVKSSRARKVPLTPEFKEFLQMEFGSRADQIYMLHSEAEGKRYRWDFRRPFETYMASHGLWRPQGSENVTPHSMRHTYITRLADEGYSAAQISAWSGDRIRTLETNYLHTSAPDGAVDRLYSKNKRLTLDEIADSIQSLKGQIGEDTAKAMQNLLTTAKQHQSEHWEWTEQVPDRHRKLYSVEDTIENRVVFESLFDPDDGSVSEYDWKEGEMSTKRARLKELESIGWICPFGDALG